jgi:nucleotide-binding universal stress UspA family protein
VHRLEKERRMQKIMLATDFSERSDRALRRATLLAKEISASLVLVHVVDDDRPRWIVDRDRKDAVRLLGELTRTVQDVDGLACEGSVVLSDPFDGIVQETRNKSPDLLVIGSHRRRLLMDVFIGTTAERTIRSVECPVLMVNAPPVGFYRRVLHATDLSDNSRAAMEGLAGLTIGANAACSLLHVFEAPALRVAMAHTLPKEQQEDYLQDARASASQALARFVAASGVWRAEQIVRHEETTVANEVRQAAIELESDLIVLATHGRSGFVKLFLGSVAEEMLRMSQADVLVFPGSLRSRQ